MKTKKEAYCQFLLSSQINYTCTYFGEHSSELSHDSVTRYLRESKLCPRDLWEYVRSSVNQVEHGYIIFDDTVLSKIYSNKIQMVRRQYSGNVHGIIKGIGVVNCVYCNPLRNEYWVIDYRIFDPEGDGKTKIDHVMDMLKSLKYREIKFSTVLMDSWYATTGIMMYLISEKRVFYCPIKSNRKVDDSKGQSPYAQVRDISWTKEERKQGKTVKLHKFPMDNYLKLFRVDVSTDKTEYIVTNDMTQDNADDALWESAVRWNVERVHREEKQTTGIQNCQCRSQRAQRNHINAAMSVWAFLKKTAKNTRKTVYQVKHQLLDEYMKAQLSDPTLIFA
jgi:Transposase DDE domain